MEPKIVYEDEELLIIDKPTGLVVNRAATVARETLQDWMEKKFSIFNFQFSNKDGREFVMRRGLVHRLDKETSGVMVLAKNPLSFQKLKDQFKKRKVEKEYLALVHGKLEPQQGNINLPLSRNPQNRKRFTVRLGGRRALTFYKVEKHLKKNGTWFSLVKLIPKSGRTHQLRVHLKYIGHPMVSDPLYLSKKQLREDLTWCPRLFLHAAKLCFLHPVKEEKVCFQATLPIKLKASIMSQLEYPKRLSEGY